VTDLRRRALLKASSSLAILHGARAFNLKYAEALSAPELLPVVDAHIHLFDPGRPGGVPWPDPSDTALYRPALPPRYQALTADFGVVGAIAVECSPWLKDNDWLLQVADKNPIMVGVIGDLDPATPAFPQQLEHLSANPLFRGIRYGNLWGRSLGAQLTNPEFVANLKRLSGAGLLLETANPNPVLIAEILKLTDLVPELRVVIDHLPQAVPPAEPAARKAYEHDLRALGQRGNVFVKGSEILRQVNGKVPDDLDTYKPWLDQIWEIFGEDRLLFGSDWPNSDHLAPYAATFHIISRYLNGKGRQASEKFFWKNSVGVYHWHPRTAGQAKITA
jgi:predicted TIM-barrel fold metal-dependent hydrolase